jgi:uncharacterized protein (UPF0335 family)
MTKEYIHDKIRRLKEEKDVLQAEAKDIAVMVKTGVGENGKKLSKKTIVYLRDILQSNRKRIRAIPSSIKKLSQTMKKKGTLLPFSPYITPSFYRTRKAMNNRVHRGFMQRAHKKEEMEAQLHPTYKTDPELQWTISDRHIRNASNDYNKWIAKKVPLTKKRKYKK